MATLDDKLLGEKTHYYCSSSEDEDEPNKSSTNPAESGVNQFLRGGYTHGALKQLPSTNVCDLAFQLYIPKVNILFPLYTQTGPKGVIQDWQEFKRLEAEKRDGQEVGRLKLMEKLSLSCKSYLEEQTNQQQNQADEDLDKLLDEDPFMHEYIKKRMAQMMDKISIPSTIESRFGQLIHLKSGTDFVKAIDEEDKNVIVICHLFNLNIEGCVALNGCLQCLAEQYKFVKFCMLEANSAGMSREFVSIIKIFVFLVTIN